MQLLQKIGIFLASFVILANQTFAVSDAHIGPVASFTSSYTSVKEGMEVSFDAGASTDSKGGKDLEYRWDFEGSYNWSNWSSSSKTTHTFTELGSRYTRLQIRDEFGYSDETRMLINVYASGGFKPPISKVYVTPTSGDTDTFFHFTMETISQIQTPDEFLEVRWDFNNDGVWDTQWSNSREFYHAFPEPGYKEVVMQTRDRNDLTSTERGYYVEGKENDSMRNKEIGMIYVKEGDNPRASFSAWPVEMVARDTVNFDASASVNSTKYRWDFDGDGNFDTRWSESPKATFTYEDFGVFEVILEVMNANGEKDTDRQSFEVADRYNIPPEVKLTIRNKTNSSYDSTSVKGAILDEIYFDASGSRDEDGNSTQLKARWDFDGDGTWDTNYSTTKNATHEYLGEGWYTPKVEVIDVMGGKATRSASIQIVKNTAPVASLVVTPTRGNRETDFRFDASGSRDMQTGTSKIDYRFDFDGDGIFDTQFSSNSIKTRNFEEVGKKMAVVEVRDNKQVRSQATFEFEVVDTGYPVAKFVADPAVGDFSTLFRFDASETTDPSGFGNLRYRWDFDSSGRTDIDFDTGWSGVRSVAHRYSKTGLHTVHLAVKNEEGRQSDYYQTIKVHSASPYLKVLQNNGIKIEGDLDLPITRGELALLIAKAAKITTPSLSLDPFTDVSHQSSQAASIYAVAKRAWISPRSDFSFQPDANMNRAEAVKALLVALYPKVAQPQANHFLDVDSRIWYARFANLAFEENLLDFSDNNFEASRLISRGEVAEIAGKLIQKYPNKKISFNISDASKNLFSSILSLWRSER